MKTKYLLIIMSILTFSSCNQDEFLDKDPYDAILTENLITDFASLKAAVNGAYEIFQDTYYYNSYFTILPDLMGDNVKRTSYVFPDIDKYETLANNRSAQRIWDKISSQIAQTSITIALAESFNFGADQEAATKLIGQLYIARSLAYFDMQRLFAQPYNFTSDASHLGAPLADEVQIGIELISPGRSTTSQVYDKIVADILKGIGTIGDDASSAYYLNKNSAKALLARVYLYMENWEEANKLASEVIGSGYSLISNSGYISSWAKNTTSESIFSLVNSSTDNSGYSSITYYYSRPRFKATNDIFNALDAGDVRKGLISANKILKFSASTRDNNIPVIRLSEMYLIKAEALAEMNMEGAARTAVNTIRLRANPTATPYAQTGSALKDVIQEERRKELMFEGHRVFDLTRTKRSFTKYSGSAGSAISITYPHNKTILPIPQVEIDRNDNISEADQNAGY